jgi:hypothetical protein
MKPSRTILVHTVFAVAGIALLAPSARAQTSDILTPAKRAEVLEQAKQLLATRPAPAVTADPFHSEAFAEATGAIIHAPVDTGKNQVAARTGQDLLQAIAANLKPSGNFLIGGQHTLVFGQKRVKAGGTLTITFEGTEYTLEVTAIETNNFTLRLNREEFTRPIK